MAKTLRKETRKERNPWFGWKSLKPSSKKEKITMKRNCGKKCFLGSSVAGSQTSFPICSKGTCTINKKGLWAAYIRAREFGSPKKKSNKKHNKSYYKKIAKKSQKMLKRF